MVEVIVKTNFVPNTSKSHDFKMLTHDADDEESDAPTTPDLRPAEYSICIKCKNPQNNPMYRFCEKCYQVNKYITSHIHHHPIAQLIC